jgi:hypothetical protein
VGADEARKIIEELFQMLPANLWAGTKRTTPFATNHQLSIEVLDGSYPRCRAVADALSAKIEEKSYKIKGKQPSVAVEVSPVRRSLCRNFYGALDLLRSGGIGEDKILICNKGLKLYDKVSFKVLGSSTQAGVWKWEKEMVVAMGLSKLVFGVDEEELPASDVVGMGDEE